MLTGCSLHVPSSWARVERGYEQDGYFIQHAWSGHSFQQLANRDEAGILAVTLARMDAALKHEQRNFPGADVLGSQGAAAGDEQRPQGPPFSRAAVFERADSFGPGCRKLAAQPFDLLDPSRLPEVGFLGERRQRLGGHC
jgi:hypothetical protein